MTISYKYKVGDLVYIKSFAEQGELSCSTVSRIFIDGVKTPELHYVLANNRVCNESDLCSRYEAVGFVIQHYREKLDRYVRLQQEIWNETDGGEA